MISVQMIYCSCIEINSTQKNFLCFCIDPYLSISNAFSKSRVITLNSWNGSLYMLRRFQNALNILLLDPTDDKNSIWYLCRSCVFSRTHSLRTLQCSAVIRHSADYKIPIYFDICLYLKICEHVSNEISRSITTTGESIFWFECLLMSLRWLM